MTKNLREGLDLSPPGGCMTPPIYPHHRYPDATYVDYDDYDNLRRALEAALAVVEAEERYDESMTGPYAELVKATHDRQDARKALETALEVFMVGEGEGKE